MKKHKAFLLWAPSIFFSIALHGQDTLYRKGSGDVYVVKVVEVGESRIVTKRLNLPDGPNVNYPRGSFSRIVFSNGETMDLKLTKEEEANANERAIKQLLPGRVLLTGGFGYYKLGKEPNYSGFTGEPRNVYDVNIKIGVAVSQNFIAGASMGIGNGPQLFPGNTSIDEYYVSLEDGKKLGVFIRPYKKIGSWAAFHANLGANYVFGKSRVYLPGNTPFGQIFLGPYEAKLSGFNFEVIPGFSVFLSNTVALDISICELSFINANHTLKNPPPGTRSELKENLLFADMNLASLRFAVSLLF